VKKITDNEQTFASCLQLKHRVARRRPRRSRRAEEYRQNEGRQNVRTVSRNHNFYQDGVAVGRLFFRKRRSINYLWFRHHQLCLGEIPSAHLQKTAYVVRMQMGQ
jgi:hypothetical protein